MDTNVKKYLTAALIAIVVVYAIAHVDTLRENILGLPPIA